jgi:hypothetical protein
MTLVGQELNREFHPNSRLAFDQHLRLGASGRAWPARAGLESRTPASRTPNMVNFVRCGALQSHVRPVGVVPAHGALHGHLERATPQRHHGQNTRAFLEGADATFHDSNAAPLADGAETLVDGVAATPLVQTMITELLALVGNQMPGCRTDAGNDPTEKLSDVHRTRLAQEKPEAQDASRIMIDNHRQPPAERPALR